jgi:hypothetical protein
MKTTFNVQAEHIIDIAARLRRKSTNISKIAYSCAKNGLDGLGLEPERYEYYIRRLCEVLRV